MNIRSKIIAFQAFFVGVVIALAVVVYLAVARAEYFIERVRGTHTQLEAITSISLHANRYSEQIAEMLLFGQQGRAEFEEARRHLEESFAALVEATEDETLLLYDDTEHEEERDEFVVLSQMRSIGDEMHVLALDLLKLKTAGRQEEAYRRYYDEIEQGLDDDMQRLIDIVMADEREEVRRLEHRAGSMARELSAIVVVVTVMGGVTSMIMVLLIGRALSQPISRLTEGAAEIGNGRLDHRIAVHGRDELALLSNHFNRMAAQLEIQRGELLQQQALLEQKVRERTLQLEDANRRLENLNRLRILFLADVSHELRTPLAVLRGEAEVTLRSRSSSADDCRDTLERIVEQAEHMARLVDDLLFVTRAEADSIRFEMRRLDLRQILDQAVEDGCMLALDRGLELAACQPAEPVYVHGDGQRLHQTLLIAIDNAVKYAQPQTTVEVELGAADGQCLIVVRNYGAGVPTEDLPYVFDRFYRGRQNASPSGGSGLGLSIAKWIVEKHAGTIALASKPGGVTELEIRLPGAWGNDGESTPRTSAGALGFAAHSADMQ
jgi:two-component system, OmpR family, sensor kinase